MKIMVVGSGGREDALCWKIAQSPKCTKLYCIPGNGGISRTAECVDIKADNVDALLKFAKANSIDLTVVGPEAPLVAGIVDKFENEGLRIFGPSKAVAALEGSKVFAKEKMLKFRVPTAAFRVFKDFNEASKYAETVNLPVVIKADGLASGKGVVICKTREEAKDALNKMMVRRSFGAAGDKVIIEECLVGEEASILVISYGKNVVPLPSSQDHKRIFDNDRGPNTGGMGAYSPAPVVTDELFRKVMETVIYPMIEGLSAEGTPYKGALYAGIMVTEKGPFVLEFNARFGDPETQAIMPRLVSDLVEIAEKAIDGDLEGYPIEIDPRPCVSVVIASGGYPDKYENGMEIRGLEGVKGLEDVIVFHAGTKIGKRFTDGGDLVITNGGRVLNVTALGETMKEAIVNCYGAIRFLHFDKMQYRKDIGRRAITR